MVEVLSEGTAKRDRGIKYDDYQAHGVEEYWILDADQQYIEQYHLVNGNYELILKAAEGHVSSFVLQGFTIPVQAAFDEALNRQVMADILQGKPLHQAGL